MMSVPFGGASYSHIPEITRYQITKRLAELRPDIAQRIHVLDDGLSMIVAVGPGRDVVIGYVPGSRRTAGWVVSAPDSDPREVQASVTNDVDALVAHAIGLINRHF